MSLHVKVGSFTALGSTGTIETTGIGFIPVVVLFLYGDTLAWRNGFGVGISSTEQWAGASTTIAGVSPTENDKGFSASSCILVSAGDGTLDGAAEFVTSSAAGNGSFAINVTTAASASVDVYYIAIGGDDITANAGTFNSPTSTGNQAITGVGFTPRLVLLSNSLASTSGPFQTGSAMMLGAATGASQWVASYEGSNLATPSVEDRYYNTDRVLAPTDGTSSAAFVSNDSDGFTINYTVAIVAKTFGYLALGGAAQYYLGSFASAVTTGNQSVTGVGFRPKLELFSGNSHTAIGSTTHSRMVMGMAASSSAQRVYGMSATDTRPGNSESVSLRSTSKCILHASGALTTDADAAFVSQDADGFTVNWTTADASARVNLFIAIGAALLSCSVTSPITDTQGVTSTLSVSQGVTSTITDSIGLGSIMRTTKGINSAIDGSQGIDSDLDVPCL